jgi:hypothetical protein
MAQATTASIPHANSVQQAASAIVALINSSPRSPRQEEIEAIIANVAPSGTAPATPLLMKIRETAARLGEAFDVQGKVHPADKAADKAAQARIDEFQDELDQLEDQIASPPQSFADLVAWAEIARSGADLHTDGTMGEAEEDDVFLRPAARLIEAVLQFGGALQITAMSPAHAEHYREWRRLIEAHVREFEYPGLEYPGDTGGGITEESEAEEARMDASLEVINDIADKILAEPVQMWGDLLPCAEVAFWYQWSGIDPQGPDAIGQMEAGPMSGGKAIDQAVSKVLAGIFTLAGVGQFAEVRHG